MKMLANELYETLKNDFDTNVNFTALEEAAKKTGRKAHEILAENIDKIQYQQKDEAVKHNSILEAEEAIERRVKTNNMLGKKLDDGINDIIKSNQIWDGAYLGEQASLLQSKFQAKTETERRCYDNKLQEVRYGKTLESLGDFKAKVDQFKGEILQNIGDSGDKNKQQAMQLLQEEAYKRNIDLAFGENGEILMKRLGSTKEYATFDADKFSSAWSSAKANKYSWGAGVVTAVGGLLAATVGLPALATLALVGIGGTAGGAIANMLDRRSNSADTGVEQTLGDYVGGAASSAAMSALLTKVGSTALKVAGKFGSAKEAVKEATGKATEKAKGSILGKAVDFTPIVGNVKRIMSGNRQFALDMGYIKADDVMDGTIQMSQTLSKTEGRNELSNIMASNIWKPNAESFEKFETMLSKQAKDAGVRVKLARGIKAKQDELVKIEEAMDSKSANSKMQEIKNELKKQNQQIFEDLKQYFNDYSVKIPNNKELMENLKSERANLLKSGINPTNLDGFINFIKISGKEGYDFEKLVNYKNELGRFYAQDASYSDKKVFASYNNILKNEMEKIAVKSKDPKKAKQLLNYAYEEYSENANFLNNPLIAKLDNKLDESAIREISQLVNKETGRKFSEDIPDRIRPAVEDAILSAIYQSSSKQIENLNKLNVLDSREFLDKTKNLNFKTKRAKSIVQDIEEYHELNGNNYKIASIMPPLSTDELTLMLGTDIFAMGQIRAANALGRRLVSSFDKNSIPRIVGNAIGLKDTIDRTITGQMIRDMANDIADFQVRKARVVLDLEPIYSKFADAIKK